MAGKRFRIREERQERLEVHVAGYCFRRSGRRLLLLVAKRTRDRELFPSRWECGGGQVRAGENFPEALRRQFFEEFGIEIRIFMPFSDYEIHRPGAPKIPGLKYLCEPKDADGEVTLNSREFSESRWVTETQCKHLRMIPGVSEDMVRAFATARQIIPAAKRQAASSHRIGFQARKKRKPGS